MTTNGKSEDGQAEHDVAGIVENLYRDADERSPLAIARETLTGDLRDAALQWIRALPKPWAQLTEDDQTNVIDSITKRAIEAARTAVELIAAGGRRVIQAEVESVTVKDGLKATMKCLKTEENLVYLGMSEGSRVQIVSADLEQFTGEKHEAKAEPSQGTLPGTDGNA